MKVALINPPFILPKNASYFSYQCLGLLYVAGFLRANGHDVQVIDAFAEGRNTRRRLDSQFCVLGLSTDHLLERIHPDVGLVGISVPFSSTAMVAHELVPRISNSLKKPPVVLGGVYPTVQPELAVHSGADYLVMGDGEEAMKNICDYLQGQTGRLLDCIVSKGTDLRRARTCHLRDVDNLPLPARDLLPRDTLTGLSSRGHYETYGWGTAGIITSRGCPYDCEFCEMPAICGRRWRPFSPSRVLREIDDLYLNHNVRHIEIEDSNFTLDNHRACVILDGLIDRTRNGWAMSWSAPNGIRIDCLSEELIVKIKESNCRLVNLALENGDAEVLSLMNKRLRLDVVLEKTRLLAKHQVPTGAFVIFGYPGESEEGFARAVEFYRRMREISPSIAFRFFQLTPLPRTRLFSRCVREGLLPPEFFSSVSDLHTKLLTPETPWKETPSFKSSEILRRKRFLTKTFSRRRSLKDVLASNAPTLAYRLYQVAKRRYYAQRWAPH